MTLHEAMAFLRTLRLDADDARALLRLLTEFEAQGRPAPDGEVWREALRRVMVEGCTWKN